ncbi:MAG: DUF4834 family protein [Muribaculaceae bacterium]|nr:DUF4834 family protein [Muribaculaceae bacterium]
MSLLVLILLILFAYYVILPVVRGLMQLNRMRSNARDFFNSMNQQAAGARSRDSQPQQPAPKKKKIDPSVGEYVDYEEITVEQTTVNATTTTDGSSSSTSIDVEQQIVDVEWEDIK